MIKNITTGILWKLDASAAGRLTTLHPDDKGEVTEQIRNANVFWRTQLGSVPESTLEIRTYLDDNYSVDAWIANFEKHIIPVIVANGLPKKL